MSILVDEDTTVVLQTPRGHVASFSVRPSTTDALTVNACCAEDEYDLPSVSGIALDVGAHIGGVAVALLLDNPDLRVIAIEALPENADLIQTNVERNGVADRCTVIRGAVGKGDAPIRIFYGNTDTEFARSHEFIGNGDWRGEDHRHVDAPVVTLDNLVLAYGEFSLLKTDCEGGEWDFLDTPAVRHVGTIVGEWHERRGFGVTRLHDLLDGTHAVEASGTGSGPFRALRR